MQEEGEELGIKKNPCVLFIKHSNGIACVDFIGNYLVSWQAKKEKQDSIFKPSLKLNW